MDNEINCQEVAKKEIELLEKIFKALNLLCIDLLGKDVNNLPNTDITNND